MLQKILFKKTILKINCCFIQRIKVNNSFGQRINVTYFVQRRIRPEENVRHRSIVHRRPHTINIMDKLITLNILKLAVQLVEDNIPTLSYYKQYSVEFH